MSIDGVPEKAPWLLRLVARTFLKRWAHARPMRPGLRLPAAFAKRLIPNPTTAEEGLKGLREAIGRLQATDARHPSPLLGSLTRDEWDQLHCRHAELHPSFLVPVKQS
jgi:hypothetical protein